MANDDANDQNLMRAYVATRSEDAFAALVHRHINLVYATALRILRNPSLVPDVTQRVFLAMARESPKLEKRASISGWLHETARNLAINTVRTEERRRAREHEAFAMNTSEADGGNIFWKQIEPELDDALTELADSDRDLLLWRYFEGQTAEQIGRRLGVGAEASQKRILRAVERLRGIFASRALNVSATALAAALSAQALQAAPAGLAASVIASGAGVSILASSSVFQIFMASTKAKIGLAAALALVAVTPVVLQHRENGRLNAEIQRLRTQLESPPLQPVASDANAAELERLRREHDELMRLRAEVSRLRAELTNQAKPTTAPKPAEPQKSDQSAEWAELLARSPEIPMITSNAWANVGYTTAASAMQTMHWATIHRDTNTYLASLRMDPAMSKSLEDAFALLPKAVHEKYASVDDLLIDWQFTLIPSPTGYRIFSETPDGSDRVTLEVQSQYGDGRVGGGTTSFGRDEKGWYQVVRVPTSALSGIANDLLGVPNPDKGNGLPIGQ